MVQIFSDVFGFVGKCFWTMISVDFIWFHLVSKIVDMYDSTFSVALKFWN